MVELNREEERALRELIRATGCGKDAAEFISNRLNVEMSHFVGTDSHGNSEYSYESGYERQLQVYESLAAKGMLVEAGPAVARSFGDLTTDGRCYFSTRRRAALRRWAPVFASALIAGFFSLAGVVLGAWLNGWRP